MKSNKSKPEKLAGLGVLLECIEITLRPKDEIIWQPVKKLKNAKPYYRMKQKY